MTKYPVTPHSNWRGKINYNVSASKSAAHTSAWCMSIRAEQTRARSGSGGLRKWAPEDALEIQQAESNFTLKGRNKNVLMLIHSCFTVWLAVRATRFVAYLLGAGKKKIMPDSGISSCWSKPEINPIRSAQNYLYKISVKIGALILSGISVT